MDSPDSPTPDEELERRSPSKDREYETGAVGNSPDHDEDAEPGLRPEDVAEEEEEERRPPLPAIEGEPNPGLDRITSGGLEVAAPSLVDPEATARHGSGLRAVDIVVIHPSQTRFTCPCPGCQLSYPTHHSLVRHVGVSHQRMSLNITFKCAGCDYAHASLRSTSLHYRHAHGVVPPQQIDGSNEKRCPFCPTTFPSTRSCSTHIREKHMEEMCAQRAREAAQKAVQQGESTARTKWTQQEIERFKAALAKHGPASNIKLAAEIRTRDTHQVNVYKCRFLKAYPTWLKDNYHPAQPTANARNSRHSSSPTRSPPSSQATEDRSPVTSTIQAPTAMGTRARPANSRGPAGRTRRATATPTSPPSSTATPPGTQPVARTSTPPPPARVNERQYCSPEVEAALQPLLPQATTTLGVPPASQEERTPSPPPATISEGGALRLQRLDQALRTLRSNNIVMWDPEAPCFSPPVTDLVAPIPTPPLTKDSARTQGSPGVGVSCQPQSPPPATILPAPTSNPVMSQPTICSPHRAPRPSPDEEERTPSPAPVQLSKEGVLRVQRLDRMLQLLRPQSDVGLDLDVSLLPPPAGIDTPISTLPTAEPATNVPASTPLIAPAAVRMPLTPGEGVEQPSTSSLEDRVVSDDHLSDPPPSVFCSLINARPFIPRMPAVVESSPPTLPSLPGPPPPQARIPGPMPRIAIDVEDMDGTLRLPFHNELLPFADRLLGEFEWLAFEEVLNRWSVAIKAVTTSRHQRRANPTSKWARRRRQRQRAEPRAKDTPQPQSPRDGVSPPPPADHQRNPPPGHRASGWQRLAASSAKLQRFYRANPSACVRQLLSEGPPLYCKVGEEEIGTNFSAAYAEPPPLNPAPEWLFPPSDTEGADGGDVLREPISPEEVIQQFRRMKNTSPGVDGLTYATWRWVDPKGLIMALMFNACRLNSRIPSAWKHSTVTLIHKGGEPSVLRNWRPICLQLTSYKLYTAIIARRIASWATATSSFSVSQKGFLAYDGCSEHNFLLRSMLTDSRRQKRNLLLTWLDIREAFPSVPHHLMLFLMERLGLSGTTLRVVQDIYTGASMAVRTGKDSYTTNIPQCRGIRQGCPLSPILFNIVLEGLLRYLATSQAGYLIGNAKVNALAYADDVCVAAATKEEMQDLLDRCAAFGVWTGFRFNTRKCGSLCMVNQTPRIYVDDLFQPRLGEEVIPAMKWGDRYRYLGCPTGAFRTKEQDLNTIRATLVKDTITIFKSPLAEWQKLDVFRRFLFPRLTFVLQVIFPGSTWCRKLDTTLRGAIKQGLKMPRRTATQYLYLPQASGGLGVPSVEDVGHVTRAAQAFKFLGDTRDPIIRSVALHQLADTVAKRARRLDPTKLEDLSEFLNTTAAPGEGRAGDLHSLWSSARASLANTGAILELTSESAVLHANNHHLSWLQRKRAFQVLKEEMGARHLSTIKRSPDQGRAFDSLSLHPDSSYFTYSGAFLSFYQYRFVHKARLNLLPVRTVQARCRKLVPSTQCRHCGRAEETLAHILNHCHQHLWGWCENGITLF